MKSVFKTLIAASLLTLSLAAFAEELPQTVNTAFKKAYAADGFDTNDNVQIVAEGLFANTCYRYAKAKVQVDHLNKKIILTPLAYKYKGVCRMMVVEYNREIEIGILKEGTYKIVQGKNAQQIGEISVHASQTADADDYVYASISQAYYKPGFVTLTGNLSLSCMKLAEVKTDIQPDVFVLQPIVEIDKTVPCTEGNYPIEVNVSTAGLKSGRYLVHVRSMNGNAVNNLIDIP
jgi:hypothetical protein